MPNHNSSGSLMVVDDNMIDREQIRRLVGSEFDVIEADSARSAVARLESSQIDCVLLDYRLPDANGTQLIQDFANRRIPVIILTGQGNEAIAVDAMKRGAQDYLTKEKMDAIVLRRAITNALDKTRLQQLIADQQAELHQNFKKLENQQTDLERANRTLREREAKLRLMLEKIPAIVWSTDPSLFIMSLSGAALTAAGVDPLPFLGQEAGELFNDSRQALQEAHQVALAGGSVKVELTLRNRTFTAHVEPLRNEAAIVGVVGVALDISDSRGLEAQLRQVLKMEAVGRLAGGVAHDFNNILTVILSYSNLLIGDLTGGTLENGDILVDLHEIKKAGEKAASLTKQLLAFSRQQPIASRLVNLNDVVGDSEKMLRRLLNENIIFQCVYAPELWCVKLDPGQIDQILLNLVVNARDAMPDGGRLTIQTENVLLAGNNNPIGVKAGPHVLVTVSDTGTGISTETLERVFEPFFTTKAPGEGTGLGLSMVYGIVNQNHGGIRIDSKIGNGTTIKIYFPQSEEARNEMEPIHRAPSKHGSETILLAEDEEEVRTVTRNILERHGYKVIVALNAEEALRHCEEHPGDIHLLLTDVIMPHVDGPALAERISAFRPAMKVLYMSGYTQNMLGEQSITAGPLAFIQKPLTPESLTLKIREVLDGGS